MGDNPFRNTPFAMFGGQIAQAWQTGLEAWWKALLADRGRLVELARHLGDAGLHPPGNAQAADDLTNVLEALELMDARIAKVEQRLDTLSETLEAMVTFLEEQSGATS